MHAGYNISLAPKTEAEHQSPEPERQPPRVTVVVVSHNRKTMLQACLEALEKSEGRERLQIVVVDNGSRDGSPQLDSDFPNVQWIRLPKNFGLTKAMNLGWRAADAEYVFFLHDDTEVPPDAAMLLAGVLDANTDAAAVCPLLVDREGLPAPQLGKLPLDVAEWRAANPISDAPMQVEYPRAAALMARVFYIKATRQIDERFGQFGGDADLAAQFRRAAKKVLLVPTVRVFHEGGGNYDSLQRADLLLAHATYLGKYAGFMQGVAARAAAIFGSLARFQLGELRYILAGQKIDGTQE